MNSVANQYRILKQQVQNLGRTIGNLLMPILQRVLPMLNGLVIAINRVLEKFGLAKYGSNWKNGILDGISGGNIDGLDDIEDSIEDVGNEADNSKKKVKELAKQLQGIDELNNLSENKDDDDDSSSKDDDDSVGTIDLSGAIAQELANYEKIWNDAYEKSVNDAEKWAEAISNAFASKFILGTKVRDLIIKAFDINWKEDVYPKFNNWGSNLAEFMVGLITPNDKGETVFSALGSAVASGVNSAIAAFKGWEDTFTKLGGWEKFGEGVASYLITIIDDIEWEDEYEVVTDIAKGLAEAINSFTDTEVFDKIGEAIANLLRSGIDAWGKLVDGTNGIDFSNLGSKIGGGITTFFNKMSIKDRKTKLTGWQQLGKDIGDSISGIETALTSAINALPDFNDVGQAIINMIEKVDFPNLTWNLGGLVGALVDKVYELVSDANRWKKLGSAIGRGLNNFFSALGKERKDGITGWAKIGQVISKSFNGIITAITTAIDSKNMDWNKVGRAIGTAISGINWLETFFDMTTMVSKLAGGIITAIGGWVGEDPFSAAIVAAIAVAKLTGITTAIKTATTTALTGKKISLAGVALTLIGLSFIVDSLKENEVSWGEQILGDAVGIAGLSLLFSERLGAKGILISTGIVLSISGTATAWHELKKEDKDWATLILSDAKRAAGIGLITYTFKGKALKSVKLGIGALLTLLAFDLSLDGWNNGKEPNWNKLLTGAVTGGAAAGLMLYTFGNGIGEKVAATFGIGAIFSIIGADLLFDGLKDGNWTKSSLGVLAVGLGGVVGKLAGGSTLGIALKSVLPMSLALSFLAGSVTWAKGIWDEIFETGWEMSSTKGKTLLEEALGNLWKDVKKEIETFFMDLVIKITRMFPKFIQEKIGSTDLKLSTELEQEQKEREQKANESTKKLEEKVDSTLDTIETLSKLPSIAAGVYQDLKLNLTTDQTPEEFVNATINGTNGILPLWKEKNPKGTVKTGTDKTGDKIAEAFQKQIDSKKLVGTVSISTNKTGEKLASDTTSSWKSKNPSSTIKIQTNKTGEKLASDTEKSWNSNIPSLSVGLTSDTTVSQFWSNKKKSGLKDVWEKNPKELNVGIKNTTSASSLWSNKKNGLYDKWGQRNLLVGFETIKNSAKNLWTNDAGDGIKDTWNKNSHKLSTTIVANASQLWSGTFTDSNGKSYKGVSTWWNAASRTLSTNITASGLPKTKKTVQEYFNKDDNKIGVKITTEESTMNSIKSTMETWFRNNKVKVSTTVGNGLDFLNRKDGGVYSGGSWKSIDQYAVGGVPNHGTIFAAGEAGPEVVGHINSRTEVLNQSQIASAIYTATYNAMSTVMERYNGNARSGDTVVQIDGREIARATRDVANDYMRRTGNPYFAY